jgi:hypothetical protein
MKDELVAGLIIVIIVGAFGASYFAWPTTLHPPTSVASSLSPGWTVVRSGLTLYYDTACIPVESQDLSCPTSDPGSHSPYLNNVDLISYKGTYYYAVNFTYYENGQPDTHTIWFTNSTVFCMSPRQMSSGYSLCPTQPAQSLFVAFPISSASVVSPSGLRLELRLAADNSSGGSIGITVEEQNTLDHVNNVTAANSWRIPTFSLRGVYDLWMVGYTIYKGYYDADNFTSRTSLALMEVGSYISCSPCPAPTYFLFQPTSDNATLSPGSTFPYAESSSTMPINLTEAISGYWTSSDNFVVFPPGIYTVVAADEWGQVAVLHFTAENG